LDGYRYFLVDQYATHANAGRRFELLARNDLGDGGFATPVICGSRIYLRTLHHLYCF